MSGSGKCKFYEWDEATFVLPGEYILDDNSDLADALNVFYLAGGHDFFNVVEPEYYAINWLGFVGNLYSEIMDDKYISNGKKYTIPLTNAKKKELIERGVPEIFLKDIIKKMTREEIIKALEDGITSWGMYNVNWDAMDAIEADAEPFSYVKPILDIIAAHPDIDFGTPGQLVHFVEKFSNQGYEELLIESVRKSPTPHNIWMIHRCYNDVKNPLHDKFADLIRELRESANISDEIKNAIEEFTW